MNTNQIEMVSLDDLVSKRHPYRKLKEAINFNKLAKVINTAKSETGAIGYTIERLLMCLILQFMENLSDRELERLLQENTAAKWFCSFSLTEKTPDFTTICKFRNRLGVEQIKLIFEKTKKQLSKKGYMAEVFTFIDSTALITQLQMWEERDKAIADGYKKFNNEVIEKYAKDKEVRIGSKGAKKFWFGFKKLVTVDMQSGMINNVKVVKANTSDDNKETVTEVLPKQGAVLGDKGFIGAIETIKSNNCHPMIILKNNMKEKNKEKDKFISKLRSPLERVFSKQEKRARYKGVDKNQVAEYLYAMAHNFKRLIVLESISAT